MANEPETNFRAWIASDEAQRPWTAQQIFLAAIVIDSDEVRAAYVAQACGDDPDMPLAVMNNACIVPGRTGETLKLFGQVLQLQTARLGRDHPDTLKFMERLADWYVTACRPQEAIKLDEETLQRQTARLGRDHPDTLASMIRLARSNASAGHTDTAIDLFEETLELARAKHGAVHPAALTSMIYLADSYVDDGRIQAAIGLREETLRLSKAEYGADNPHVLMCMNILARSYAETGRTRDALELFEETLQLQPDKSSGDPDSLESMKELAGSYVDTGRTREALELLEKRVELMKEHVGLDERDTLISMKELARSYADAGRTREAINLRDETREHFEKRLALMRGYYSPGSPSTLEGMNDLASCYTDAGRTREALELLEERLALMKEHRGPEDRDTLISMSDLARSYAEVGRSREATNLREETLQLLQDKLGLDHPDTLGMMNILAKSYTDEGQVAKAVAILQEILALRERRVNAAPGDAVEQVRLALTHGQMGESERVRLNYACAVQAYGASVEILEKLDSAGALKAPLFQDNLNSHRQLLANCRKAEQAVKDLDFALRQPAEEVLPLLDLRVSFLLREHELAAAVEAAARMKELAGNEPESLYFAACEFALCAGAAKPARSPVARALDSEELADEALALLKQAVAGGFRDAAHMNEDKDLDALRAREDFQKLLSELVKESDYGSRRVETQFLDLYIFDLIRSPESVIRNRFSYSLSELDAAKGDRCNKGA